MIIDVNDLKRNSERKCEFDFSYLPNPELLGIPSASFEGGAKVCGEAFLCGSDVEVEAELSYVVIAPCSRCLSRARAEVKFPFSAKFSLFPEEDEYLYKSGKVDLTKVVDESVILSSPIAVYCRPDCKGLCPVCGADLNVCDCGHGRI